MIAAVLADLAALARHPRAWWRNATHAPCPVCGRSVHVGRAWQEHRVTHPPAAWQAARRRSGGRP